MNYIGYKVKHKLFGVGEIISQDEENRIIVRFSAGEKEFSAPKCFETFLTLLDAGARAEAKEHIVAQVEKERKEAEARKRSVWEKTLNNAAERKEANRVSKQIKVKSYASLTEFFDAQKADLDAEAGYLRSTGGKRHRITDGEHISFSGDRYVYAFESDTELSLPDNIGITLWKGDQSFSATLVNCEDFNLVIAVSTFLGNRVPEIEFTSEPWKLLYDLKDRLDHIRINPSMIVKSLILEGRQKVLFSEPIRTGQQTAVEMCRYYPITFIWGPPGTGKTETLATIALEHIAKGERVLMLSHSNVSVDEAAMRVLRKDTNPKPGKIVRYGYPKKKEVLTHSYLSSYNLCLMKHPELVKKREALIDEKKHLQRTSPRAVQIGKELTKIREQLKEEEKAAVKAAGFAATTVSKAIADSTVHDSTFDTVIFDEASMAHIPQIIFSASLAKKHFVCIGDFAQLPPIVQSDKAGNLNADIFQYCGITEAVERGYGHEWLCMLNVQHRMHPDIASFVSKRIYHNLLESAPGMAAKRAPIAALNPVKGEPLVVMDLSGMMTVCTKTKDQSRFNVLSALIAMGIAVCAARGHEVGVITPYNAQSRLLHAMSRDIAEREAGIHRITCATVHQFQGSEKDMIVYDAVDCYRMPYPGMMISSENNNYANRLFNVAMTRAKGKMVSLVNVDYMETKKLSITLMFRQLMNLFSEQRLRGRQVLQEMDQKEMACTDNQSLDSQYLKELSMAREEVRIDIPGSMRADAVWNRKFAATLQELVRSGKSVTIRAENKQLIPAEIRSMAIENEYVANPITMIDKQIIWFGEPASEAGFVAEGKQLAVWCRPVIRFEGKHTAKVLYNLLEMSNTVDMDDQMNEEGTYDTFAAYVRGELVCEECGKPLSMGKGKGGKFYIVCSDPKCKTFAMVEPGMVENYLCFGNRNGRICPEHGVRLKAGQGKKNVYVYCDCGRDKHYLRLDEI